MTPPLALPPLPFSKNARLIVGVSGGSDSLGLLSLLKEARPDPASWLTVAHVNYGLRGRDSGKDEERVRNLSRDWGIPFKILRVRGFQRKFQKEKRSLQDLAREIRYAFFQREAQKQKAWGAAVAHHLEDQAETVLDRLLRGAGARGLSGLRAVQELSFGNKALRVWRPLLSFHPQKIQDHLKSLGIAWREDRTNREKLYRRNQIRLEILPFLARWNPSLSETLARIGEVLAAEDELLDGLFSTVEKKLKSRWGKDVYACWGPGFAAVPLGLQRRWIRRVCERLVPDSRGLSFDRIEEILRLWEGRETGPRDMGFGLTAGRNRNRAYLYRKSR